MLLNDADYDLESWLVFPSALEWELPLLYKPTPTGHTVNRLCTERFLNVFYPAGQARVEEICEALMVEESCSFKGHKRGIYYYGYEHILLDDIVDAGWQLSPAWVDLLTLSIQLSIADLTFRSFGINVNRLPTRLNSVASRVYLLTK